MARIRRTKDTIRKRPRLRIGYLPQELEAITGKTVLDAAHRDQYPEHEAERILMGLGFTKGISPDPSRIYPAAIECESHLRTCC